MIFYPWLFQLQWVFALLVFIFYKDVYTNDETMHVVKSRAVNSGKSTPEEDADTALEPNLEQSDLDCSTRSDEMRNQEAEREEDSRKSPLKYREIKMLLKHSKFV